MSTSKSKAVSIIIPTFNGAGRIGNCLDALRPQIAGLEAEILIVDDGSTDNITDVIARHYTFRDGKVRLIQQKNAGPAAARNRGAREATAPIIPGSPLTKRRMSSR